MRSDEILSDLTAVIADVLDDDGITISRETTANDVEDWDSLSHINIIVSLEKQFAVKFALAEIQGLNNVGEMVDLIATKTSS